MAYQMRANTFCTTFLFCLAVGALATRSTDAQAAPARTRPVTVKQTGRTIVLNNGLIQVTFSKRRARVSSIIDEMTPRHAELLNRGIGMYFDANGGRLKPPRHRAGEPRRRSYFVPLTGRGCRVIRHGSKAVEVIFNGPPSFWFPFREQAHFMLRRGKAGLFAWVIYHHAAGAPGGSLVQTRFVVKAASKDRVFTHWAIDKYARQSPLMGLLPQEKFVRKIQDTTYLLSNHQIWCKYDYCLFSYQFLCYGAAGRHTGLWMIWPSLGGCNGGPLRQELTVHQQHVDRRLAKNNILAMFSGSHFGAKPALIHRAQNWTHFFGPVFLYVNNGPSVGAMYRQARGVARRLRRQAPFRWLHSPDYPLARGALKGRVTMNNGHNPADAWAVLGPDNKTDWELQAGGYNYWTKVKRNGSFSINKIRPRTYKLSISGGNEFTDFVARHIRIGATGAKNLGTLQWRPADRGKTLWQIGVANRSATEFAHGMNVRHYGNFLRYLHEFPNDVTYTIGHSVPGRDWNFAQWGWYNKKPYWSIRFKLPAAQRGTATLTLGFCATLFLRGGLAITLNGHRLTVLHIKKSGAGLYRSAQQLRSNHFSEDALSVYVIVRQWAGGRKLPDLHELYEQLPRQGEQFIDERVVEHFLAPIREAIGRRR